MNKPKTDWVEVMGDIGFVFAFTFWIWGLPWVIYWLMD